MLLTGMRRWRTGTGQWRALFHATDRHLVTGVFFLPHGNPGSEVTPLEKKPRVTILCRRWLDTAPRKRPDTGAVASMKAATTPQPPLGIVEALLFVGGSPHAQRVGED